MRRHCDKACAQYREGGYRSGDDRARRTGAKAHRADGAASNECVNSQVDRKSRDAACKGARDCVLSSAFKVCYIQLMARNRDFTEA